MTPGNTPDSIERELVLPAPPARVWAALTQADLLAAWFGTRATIDLRPGGELVFTWDRAGESRITNRGVIEAVDPPRRFAFRWQSSPDLLPLTLVEFTLEPHPEGTRLRLVESGFATLPPELRGGSHERNTRGWQRGLDQLAQYLAA
ncbi:MAG TPA: SRPBCC domain-containing protein [Chloroflexota bacterium]|jgi:uncharacterized protein YndB with AHSA1/START domain